MKYLSIMIAVSLSFVSLYGFGKSLYYKRAKADSLGDYRYSDKITKDKTKGIPYYLVTYNHHLIQTEKHYNSQNALSYIAKYTYRRKGGFSKVEILFAKSIMKIKINDPDIRRVKSNKYYKIKYLGIQGKKRTLLRVEEYHSNGMISINTYYNSEGLIETQDFFHPSGKPKLKRYFKYIKKKRLLWKKETFNYYGDRLGYTLYSFDGEGRQIGKKFYPSSTKTRGRKSRKAEELND